MVVFIKRFDFLKILIFLIDNFVQFSISYLAKIKPTCLMLLDEQAFVSVLNENILQITGVSQVIYKIFSF